MGVRTADADFLQRLDEIDRIIVMFLEPRRDGEDIGVEDDVLCREADAGQQLVGALAYLDLAFFRVGLPNLVERSDERRVGKEWGSSCRSRWSPYHYKKK